MRETPPLFKYARHVIGFTIVVGAFTFLYLLAYRSVPESNKDIIQIAVGGMLALLAGVGAYYFGSSKDKSDADSAKQDMTTTTTTTIPPDITIETKEEKKEEEKPKDG